MPDTYAPSYSSIATREAAAAAAMAEERKAVKYVSLSSTYAFTPVAIETSGVFGPRTATFLKDLGHRLAQVTGDKKSTTYIPPSKAISGSPTGECCFSAGHHWPSNVTLFICCLVVYYCTFVLFVHFYCTYCFILFY